MTKLAKVSLWILGGISVVCSLAYAFLNYAFSDWGFCENTLYQEFVSPNNQHRAVVFERNCGATTGFSTQVSVLSVRENLGDDPGNVYIASRRPDIAEIGIRWLTSQHLLISNADSAAFSAETKIGSVTITYE